MAHNAGLGLGSWFRSVDAGLGRVSHHSELWDVVFVRLSVCVEQPVKTLGFCWCMLS